MIPRWFEMFLIGVLLLAAVILSAACVKGTAAIVIDGDGEVKAVTCTEMEKPVAGVEWVCR